MAIVIQILMVFIVVNCILKLSFWKWWQAALFGLICGLFVAGIYPAATMQSKTQIADFLNDRAIMQDAAVLVTLEASICFAYCFLLSRKLYGGKLSRWGKVLQWYPSLLVFPVLFYVLTRTIYAMPGTDFKVIAWTMAAAVTVGLPLLRHLIKWLLSEMDFRLEVHFLVSLFVCILGLITTVNGNVTYAAVDQPTDWRMLAYAASFFVASLLCGFAWNRLKWSKMKKIK